MPSAHQRKNYFIDKSFQIKFIIKFCIIVTLASLATGAILIMLSLGSTTVAIENTKVVVKSTTDFILPLIAQTLVIVIIFSALSVTILTLLTSHKIAGPLYRLRKEVEKLGDGNLNVNFNVRARDQLKNFSSALTAMAYSLRGKIESLRREFLEFKEMVEKLSTREKDKLIEKLKSIEAKINSFKGL